MTCSFDNLPYEVLCRIVECLANSKKDLGQLRLVNRRCQPLAEGYIYEGFALSSTHSSSISSPYLQFMLNPQRGKLVKVLTIFQPEQYLTTLGDSFFEIFPNIQILNHGSAGRLNWKQLSKIFTPERCRLKKVPSLIYIEPEANDWAKMICSHHQTLEKLEFKGFTQRTPIVDPAFKQISNAQCAFPRVRTMSDFELREYTLQDLDAIIDKFPRLDELYLTFMTENRSPKYLPDTQHQRLMKNVKVNCPYNEFLNFCKYFTVKFPSTQNLTLHSDHFCKVKEDDQLVPFDEAVEFWKSNMLMRPGCIRLSFVTERSSISKALEFIVESCRLNTKMSIKYSSELIAPTSRRFEIVSVTFERKGSNSSILITYPTINLGHLDLVESIGQNLSHLELAIPERVQMVEGTPNSSEMLDGGIVSHTLDNCPSLTSLTIELLSFKFLDFHAFYSNLTVLHIKFYTFVKQSLLMNLSYQVPNVTDFRIEGPFTNTRHNGLQKTILIHMPYNSFEKLTVIDSKCFVDSYTSEQISIEILSPTEHPFARYTFKRKSLARIHMGKEYEFTEEESTAPLVDRFTAFGFICKSIKQFELHGSARNNTRTMLLCKEINC